ncbi:PG1828 family lipoprotein [Dysgonomonas massiliensis]|uniref:PG1828 family lipoprotein n=1 Tax=Dysgonomonas massiliensis TaxID=2040292 RepID=UPI000C770D58|nr:hypothetical protein [Dysgonomonas massiliensis]
MKKIILLAAAAVAISFASCGNKSAQQEENANEAVETAVETVVEEAPVVDSVAAVADTLVNAAQ